jgi:hypothetical protein
MSARLWGVALLPEPDPGGPAPVRLPAPPSPRPSIVRPAGGQSSRPTGGAAEARLVLGGLDEETAFVEFDVDCNADIILGYDWLRAHDLAFLYEEDQVCLCAERGCTSGRRVRLDLALAGPSSSASRLTTMEARALLGAVGFGPVDIPGRPSSWCPPAGRPSLVAALAVAAEAAWTTDTLAGLADAGTTLDDGTDLFIGSVSFAVDGPLDAVHALHLRPPGPCLRRSRPRCAGCGRLGMS